MREKRKLSRVTPVSPIRFYSFNEELNYFRINLFVSRIQQGSVEQAVGHHNGRIQGRKIQLIQLTRN